MFEAALCVLMIYVLIMLAFMLSNMLTGYQIPWLDKTTEVLTNIAIVFLTVFFIFFFSACIYGILAKDPNFVGVAR